MTLYKPAKFELWWADTGRSRSLPAAFLFTDSSETLQVGEGKPEIRLTCNTFEGVVSSACCVQQLLSMLCSILAPE
jgi:hypothetical protein